MFAEFRRRRDRRRVRAFALAVLASGGLLSASLTASYVFAPRRQVEQEEPEEDPTMVELAPPEEVEEEPPEPEPPEPEPQPEPVAAYRPAAPRPSMTQPEEVPDEEPEESDAQLQDDGGDTGPVGGDVRGREGGQGGDVVAGPEPQPPAPPPEPPERRERSKPKISTEDVDVGKPQFVCPEPPEVRSQGLAGVVLVHVRVDAKGRLLRFDFTRGHETLKAAVRKCLKNNWKKFEPARQSDGSAVAWKWLQPFRFRARN